jgi:hypothetical protein
MATDTAAPPTAPPSVPVGVLPTAVRNGAVLALLTAVAAVVMLFLPVSETLSPALSGRLSSPASLDCGSVVLPSGDDVLGQAGSSYDSGDPGQVCASARIARGGWAGALLGASIVVLVFSLLLGDGTAKPAGSPAAPGPTPTPAAPPAPTPTQASTQAPTQAADDE